MAKYIHFLTPCLLVLLLAGTSGRVGAETAAEPAANTQVSAPSQSPGAVWSSGASSLELGLATRWRLEGWDAHAQNTDWFHGLRTRVGARFSFGETFALYGEFQDASLFELDDDSSGPGAFYYAFSGSDATVRSDRIRNAWVEFQPTKGLRLRAGRQDIDLGGEVAYPEESWQYLKNERLANRLVGSSGWEHGARAFDGASFGWDLGDHYLFGFGAKPTLGVYDVNSAYAGFNDIVLGGLSWTAKRGAWLPNSEFSFFLIGYEDDRDAPDGGIAINEEAKVWTAGLSMVGVRPMGNGSFDWLFWGALQDGEIIDLDHRAWALALEGGYRWDNASTKPWLRAGLNLASGDGSPTDGDSEGFFNLLPTNHGYYGFVDEFALNNLVDWFVELQLQPMAKLGLQMAAHNFSLLTSDGLWNFGTGAFNKETFGYFAAPNRGHRHVGYEFDVSASYQLHERVSVEAGYAFLNGSGVLNTATDEDARFAYFQVEARY